MYHNYRRACSSDRSSVIKTTSRLRFKDMKIRPWVRCCPKALKAKAGKHFETAPVGYWMVCTCLGGFFSTQKWHKSPFGTFGGIARKLVESVLGILHLCNLVQRGCLEVSWACSKVLWHPGGGFLDGQPLPTSGDGVMSGLLGSKTLWGHGITLCEAGDP